MCCIHGTAVVFTSVGRVALCHWLAQDQPRSRHAFGNNLGKRCAVGPACGLDKQRVKRGILAGHLVVELHVVAVRARVCARGRGETM